MGIGYFIPIEQPFDRIDIISKAIVVRLFHVDMIEE